MFIVARERLLNYSHILNNNINASNDWRHTPAADVYDISLTVQKLLNTGIDILRDSTGAAIYQSSSHRLSFTAEARF